MLLVGQRWEGISRGDAGLMTDLATVLERLSRNGQRSQLVKKEIMKGLEERGRAWLAAGALLVSALASGCGSPPPVGTVLADSVVGFSGVQGSDGWSYGYWDRTADADGSYDPATDFRELLHHGDDPRNGLSTHSAFTTGDLWFLEDGRFYTSLWAGGGHPHGTMDLGAYASAEHWVVRRWVSTADARVEFRGHAGKTMPWGANWGGDVIVRIVVGGDTVFEAALDDGGQAYQASGRVEVGTPVDFLIGPGTSIGVIDFTGTVQVTDG